MQVNRCTFTCVTFNENWIFNYTNKVFNVDAQMVNAPVSTCQCEREITTKSCCVMSRWTEICSCVRLCMSESHLRVKHLRKKQKWTFAQQLNAYHQPRVYIQWLRKWSLRKWFSTSRSNRKIFQKICISSDLDLRNSIRSHECHLFVITPFRCKTFQSKMTQK